MFWSGGCAPFAMIDAYSVCASVRPWRSKTTVTRSPISLKIGERDERISTVAISFVIASTRRWRTDARTGSAAAALIRPRGASRGIAETAPRALTGHVTCRPCSRCPSRPGRRRTGGSRSPCCGSMVHAASASRSWTTSSPIQGSSITSCPRPCPDQYVEVASWASTASMTAACTSAGRGSGRHRGRRRLHPVAARRRSGAPGARSARRARPCARTPSSSRADRRARTRRRRARLARGRGRPATPNRPANLPVDLDAVHAQEQRVLAAEGEAPLVHLGPDLALGHAEARDLEQPLEAGLGDPRRLAYALELLGALARRGRARRHRAASTSSAAGKPSRSAR